MPEDDLFPDLTGNISPESQSPQSAEAFREENLRINHAMDELADLARSLFEDYKGDSTGRIPQGFKMVDWGDSRGYPGDYRVILMPDETLKLDFPPGIVRGLGYGDASFRNSSKALEFYRSRFGVNVRSTIDLGIHVDNETIDKLRELGAKDEQGRVKWIPIKPRATFIFSDEGEAFKILRIPVDIEDTRESVREFSSDPGNGFRVRGERFNAVKAPLEVQDYELVGFAVNKLKGIIDQQKQTMSLK